MKGPDLMQRGGSRPLPDGLDLIFINMDPLRRDYIPQKDHLGYGKVTLLKVPIQLFLSQNTQDLVEMASMFFFVMGIHKNIIEIHHHKLAYNRPKYLIHESHKGTWCIC